MPARTTADALRTGFGETIPDGPSDPAAVVDLLADVAEPGLMTIASGRFYGWVMGGTLPAALGADWLVSAWDQNAGMRASTPGVVAAEEAAGRWLLDVLGLPTGADVGFTTGATTANFTALIAGRDTVLATAGWSVREHGLVGAPPLRVVVGAERHSSVDLALHYLGLGTPDEVGVDEQGRLRVDELAAALDDRPTIVCLQAGNIHSGAFDDIAAATEVAHARGAWVHVDGAFGLWAGASPRHRHLVTGYDAADSWATDAHKTLNVPYDCGVTVVAQPTALRSAVGSHASYLLEDVAGNPHERVPELSRRARGVPVWAALRSLGRSGVAALVDGLVSAAQGIAAGLAGIDGVEVLNAVDYTQVSFAVLDDDRTRAVAARLAADDGLLMSGSRWRDRAVIRVSVSNWSTEDTDVAATVDAVRRAVDATA